MLRGLVLTFAAFVCLAVLSSPARADPCPAEPIDGGLYGPKRVAFGRQATVRIGYDANVAAGVLEYVDPSGEVSFRHELTPAELPPGYPGETSGSSTFPISFAPGAGPLLVRFSYTAVAPWYDTACNYTRELTVRPIEGVDPRPSFSSIFSTVEDEREALLYMNRPCETLAPGTLRVVVRYHLRQRVLTLSTVDSCPAYPDNPLWVGSGRGMPGLRFGGYSSYALETQVLGQRNWKRTFRFDTYWNGRRLMRGWFQVTHERIPPSRIYQSDDLYRYMCDGASTGGGLPIHLDLEGRPYCIKPGYWSSSGRILERTPPPKKRG